MPHGASVGGSPALGTVRRLSPAAESHPLVRRGCRPGASGGVRGVDPARLAGGGDRRRRCGGVQMRRVGGVEACRCADSARDRADSRVGSTANDRGAPPGAESAGPPQTLEPDRLAPAKEVESRPRRAVPSQNERETNMHRYGARCSHPAHRSRRRVGVLLRRRGYDDTSASAGKTVVVATHDSWAMSRSVLRGVHQEDRLHRQGRAERRRRPADQQAGAHQGRADRRHGLRHRQHLRVPRRRRGHAGRRTPPTASRPPRRRTRSPTRRGRRSSRPVDYGDVCVNVDDVWFRKHGLTPPRTLDDLTKPAYKDLFVTPGATTSSPGLAFLLATIARYGDGWPATGRS